MEDLKNLMLTKIVMNSILYIRNEYVNSKRSYFEVGNGSRHTLQRVPEMMDTPPIQNNYAFILIKKEQIKHCQLNSSFILLFFNSKQKNLDFTRFFAFQYNFSLIDHMTHLYLVRVFF